MALMPQTVEDVQQRVQDALRAAEKAYKELLAIQPQDRTFTNTMAALDYLSAVLLAEPINLLGVVGMVYPDVAVQEASRNAEIVLKEAQERLIASNKAVYQAVCDYAAHGFVTEDCNQQQRYFVEQTINEYKRNGMHLADAELASVVALKNEIESLIQLFDKNIADDAREVSVAKNDLAGVRDAFIATLGMDGDGNYLLKCNYPTTAEIMPHCTVEETRRRYAEAMGNRGMPDNLILLDKIIAKRDQYAKILGFESYAAYELAGEMALSPTRVTAFLEQVSAKVTGKVSCEVDQLKHVLPEGIALDSQGRFKPWDLSFVDEQFKKKHFNIDQRKVAEYFPVEKTVDGLFGIYQKFLGLRFSLVEPDWVWHKDLKVIQVCDATSGTLRGFIGLDLHPRQGKFTHACCAGVRVPSLQPEAKEFDGRAPGFAIVIANFPKGTVEQPALLNHGDVQTFFHEFGHAMHFVMSATELHSQAGYNTKMDFVEMPSQMFEEWLYDRDLLKDISSHYQTGAHLPDELINGLIGLKQFCSGISLLRQLVYSFMSLQYFGPGEEKDTQAIRLHLSERLTPYLAPNPSIFPQASFGHLGHYGARYYGYLWSKIFAVDLFEHIKPQGLLNTQNGKMFIEAILGRGGSCPPDQMLKTFLGRDPSVDAFFKGQGFE